MPTHTTQLHHSKKTNTYTKQQTQDIKSHPTRNHQHVLYQILRKTHKPNSTTNKFLTKQDNTNTKPMATTCEDMDQMVQNISKIIEDTCTAPPIPTLTYQTNKQGGYLPKKLQKLWKKEISTYHTIRKTIKLTTQNTNWRTHPLITNLQNHPHTTIPNPPTDLMLVND
jgi:hypothetical protein